MKLSRSSLFLWFVLALLPLAVSAEKADRNKPWVFVADLAGANEQKKTTTLSGNVVLTKGTILIRGAKVELTEDAQGYQSGVIRAEAGQLAFFRQKGDGPDEYMEAEGELIEYDSRSDTVKVTHQAQLRRYSGTTLTHEFNGGAFSYNSTSNEFNIDGVRTKPGAAPGSGRARGMLMPKQNASASAPDPTRAAAPALRPSHNLAGEKQ